MVNLWIPHTEESIGVWEAFDPSGAVNRGFKDLRIFNSPYNKNKAQIMMNVHDVPEHVMDRLSLNGRVYDGFRTKDWLLDATVTVTFFT